MSTEPVYLAIADDHNESQCLHGVAQSSFAMPSLAEGVIAVRQLLTEGHGSMGMGDGLTVGLDDRNGLFLP